MAQNDQRSLYNCIDAAVTMKVWDEIRPELMGEKPGYEQCYRQTMDLYGPTIFMATHGLALDHERLEVERTRVAGEISAREAELNEMSKGKLNAMSPKSCQAYFYGTLGAQPYTNNGKITTDDKAMARLARRGFKEASLVQEIRRLNKLKSTYLDVRSDADGRIRAAWNLRGTKEGRLSSSENIFGTGLNFQNLHPQFKSFIVADPGYLFVEIDKKQAEWVITAFLAGDARMIEVIEKGLDAHIHTAHLITGLDKDVLKREDKLLGHQTDPDLLLQGRMESFPEITNHTGFVPRTMSCRQMGKKGNHGLNYRQSYVGFGLTYEMIQSEAKTVVDGYRSVYCNLPLWWEQIEHELRRSRILTNCFGRVRRFLGEWSDELVRSAISFKPASTSVDLLNRGMKRIYWDDHDYMRPHKLGAQVHDSLLSQYPIDRIDELALYCLQSHEHLNPTLEYNGRKFTIESELKIGLNWGDYNEKSNSTGMIEIPFHKDPEKLAQELRKAIGELRDAQPE